MVERAEQGREQGVTGDPMLSAVSEWRERGFVARRHLVALAGEMARNGDDEHSAFRRVLRAFNGNDLALTKIEELSAARDPDAVDMARLLVEADINARPPWKRISRQEYNRLRQILTADADALFQDKSLSGFPYHTPGRTLAYEIDWVRRTLADAAGLLDILKTARKGRVAVLVGNGPSLNRTDLSLLSGEDVFISNYAIKHPVLSKAAKAVAVTNYLVAEQEPWQFVLDSRMWKVFPFWLRNTIHPDDRTIFLNAEGGPLFFSKDAARRVAWHSTVTYFWMQVLYRLGYEKILLIGFDHSYQQSASAREGDVIDQKTADSNHFDPKYFKGKKWQAADVSKMEQAYLQAKSAFEEDGREIVNCTVGGALEAFRRADLADELKPSRAQLRPAGNAAPKIAIVTPFWKGDIEAAERHWRIINRLGPPSRDHIHLFKHGREDLPPTTFANVVCADIEREYPAHASLPHPAGPNLVFAHTLKLLAATDYTHFFWLEPDCIPTRADWLKSFREGAERHPDAPIVGVGGGATSPDKPYWKHHFAGCSLYNIEELRKLDWDRFINESLQVSFDVWMSVALGHIELLGQDDADTAKTIIFGSNRYRWRPLNPPQSVVTGMFEHWRPEKFLSQDQLLAFIDSDRFGMFHAIKDASLQKHIYGKSTPSASTIIINYNNKPFLRAAIGSALAQVNLDDIHYEVIVVDDGSDDGSLEVIKSFGDRIKPLFLSHGRLNGNFNQQRALLEALSVATGDVILLLDGDDEFASSKVATVVRRFDDPNTVLVQHALRLVDENDAHLGTTKGMSALRSFAPEHFQELRRASYFQPTSGLAFRRCYLIAASRFLKPDPFHRTWLDVRLTRLATYYGKVINITQELGSWRRHPTSDSVNRDNLRSRVTEHHDWLNGAGRNFALRIDYRGSKHDWELRTSDVLAPLTGANRLRLHRGPEPKIIVESDGGPIDASRFCRGRMAVRLGPDTDLSDRTVALIADFDLILPLSALPKVAAAFRKFPKRTQSPGDKEGVSGGYAFIVCGEDSSDTAADAKSAGESLGKKVFFVGGLDEEGLQASDSRSVLEALGYTTSLDLVSDGNALEMLSNAVGAVPDLASSKSAASRLGGHRAGETFAPYARQGQLAAMETVPFSREDKAQIDECALIFEVVAASEPSGIMIDVGAHFGSSLGRFARAGWRVYAFEPDPGNRQKLLERYEGKENVDISSEAVAEIAGQELPFYASDESTGISGLTAFRDSHREVARVRTTTLDEVVARHGLDKVDFLKIDVEGSELAVLRGLAFDRLKPLAIMAEFEDSKTGGAGYTSHDIAKFLLGHGYSVYVSEWHPIERYGVRHSFRRLRKYPCGVPSSSWGNLVAFLHDPDPAVLKRAIRVSIDRRVAFEGESEESSPAARRPADGKFDHATSRPAGRHTAGEAGRKTAAGFRFPRVAGRGQLKFAELARPMRRWPFASAFLAVAGVTVLSLPFSWPLLSVIARPEVLFALLAANLVLTAIVGRIVRKSFVARLNALDQKIEEDVKRIQAGAEFAVETQVSRLRSQILKELRRESEQRRLDVETLVDKIAHRQAEATWALPSDPVAPVEEVREAEAGNATGADAGHGQRSGRNGVANGTPEIGQSQPATSEPPVGDTDGAYPPRSDTDQAGQPRD